MEKKGKIAIVGSGLIGRSWAMLFAGASFQVSIYDVVKEKVNEALEDIENMLNQLETNGTLRGNLSAKEQFMLITGSYSLQDCLQNAIYCQECVFENLELKTQVMKKIDQYATNQTILASSTSCFLPSLFTESLNNRSQAVVAHPINPPYFVPLVEIVPASWTSAQTLEKTKKIMNLIGQKPVVLKKEIQGFIVNRIQYAILDECYRLIADNIISVDDVDAVMSEGLGMRYAFLGPWETAHLNANGIGEYFEKYAKGIYEVSKTFGPTPRMKGPVAEHITKEMLKKIPLESLNRKRKWRDECLIAISQLKRLKKTE